MNAQETPSISEDMGVLSQICMSVESALSIATVFLNEIHNLNDSWQVEGSPDAIQTSLPPLFSSLSSSLKTLATHINELLDFSKKHITRCSCASLESKHIQQDREKVGKQCGFPLPGLQLYAQQCKLIAKQRTIQNWEKLFVAYVGGKSHGRRWKFYLKHIKTMADASSAKMEAFLAELDKTRLDDQEKCFQVSYSADVGVQPDEIDNRSDAGFPVLGEPGIEGDQLHHDTTDLADQVVQDNGSTDSESAEEKIEFTETESLVETAGKNYCVIPQDKKKHNNIQYTDVACWTHEIEYDWSLNIRVYAPEGLNCREISCLLHIEDKKYRTGILDLTISDDQDVHEPSSDSLNTREPDEENTKDTEACNRGSVQRYYEEVQISLPDTYFKSPPDTHKDINIAVHYGPFDEMVGLATLSMKSLFGEQSLPVYTFESEDDFSEVTTSKSAFVPTTMDIPIYSINAGFSGLSQKALGHLHLDIYWGKHPKHRTLNKNIGTLSLDEVVREIIDYDVTRSMKEEIIKDVKDESTSVRTCTPSVHQDGQSMLVQEHQHQMRGLQEHYELQIQKLIEELQMAQSNTPSNTPINDRQVQEPSVPQPTSAPEATGHLAADNDIRMGLSCSPHVLNDETFPLKLSDPVKPEKKIIRKKQSSPWGKSFPADFYKRLEYYQTLNHVHHQELIERICTEVRQNVEKSLAVQHYLYNKDVVTTGDSQDVCLPAIFMPLKTRTVYNPRANQYFHPPGYSGVRITQPPTFFEVPPLTKTTTPQLNLFRQSMGFHLAKPSWLSENLNSTEIVHSQLQLPTLPDLRPHHSTEREPSVPPV